MHLWGLGLTACRKVDRLRWEEGVGLERAGGEEGSRASSMNPKRRTQNGEVCTQGVYV